VKIETENQNRKNSFPKLRFNKIEYLEALKANNAYKKLLN
jgi:hypothetical protein